VFELERKLEALRDDLKSQNKGVQAEIVSKKTILQGKEEVLLRLKDKSAVKNLERDAGIHSLRVEINQLEIERTELEEQFEKIKNQNTFLKNTHRTQMFEFQEEFKQVEREKQANQERNEQLLDKMRKESEYDLKNFIAN
jgi:hypothetical protein